MIDLRELYQDLILDHGKRPRNFGRPVANANRAARGHNPLCGDKLTITLRVDEEGVISDLAFDGAGCAISTASASLMTETLKGKSVAEALTIFEQFHHLVTDGECPDDVDLGSLEVFAGVKEFPVRVKCATLAWHTVVSALDVSQSTINSPDSAPTVSTE
ncbi:MAG: SUF system NifU family Fe-S cluster assembly protein [Myxococcales bacterium]|nr:SUF system NifU family Fe-S cluster assembly protein [Myxococcales bacterium]